MNLLTDPLLPLLLDAGERQVADLPTLLAAYGGDRVADLPFLRPHQRAPWHSFCVQLGALALHRAGLDQPVQGAERWRELLRGLTVDWPEDEPWRLVIEDVAKPAFMQPPVPAGGCDPHKTPIDTADDMDVLVTSKNHGVKQCSGAAATPAAWVAALVLLQTTGVYYGSGNYGVCRMRPISQHQPGSARPFVGLVPPGGPGAHWRRDVAVLLRERRWFFERNEDFAEQDGAALLWCEHWDGERSLRLGQLDPWCIEVCRRVRLYCDSAGQITARSVGSSASRIAAKDLKGNVGDPWIPINLAKDSAAYNSAPRYAVMSAVLFDRDSWLRPLLLDVHDGIDASAMTARFDVLARGQGTTEGHHRREVRFERRQLGFLQVAAERDRLAVLSMAMIEHVGSLRLKVLKIPLLSLVQAGKSELNFRDNTANAWVQPWLDQVDHQIEPVFFDHLFRCAEQGDEVDVAWIEFLRTIARDIFDHAAAALPITGPRRLKAIAVAEIKLGGLFHNNFGGYLADQHKEAVNG